MKFTDLTWEDLQEWAGDRVVNRGKSYKNRVEDLRVTADGALLAWVEGTDRYATCVRMDASGDLSADCTCPFEWGPCKHAVAVILAYLDAGKNKRETPMADPDDERFAELEEADLGDDGMDEDDDDDSSIDAAPRKTGKDDPVRKHLEGLSKDELVNLLLEGRNIIPELRHKLSDQAEVRSGNVAKMIASARREIDRVAREPAWSDHWRDESSIPDYSRVKQKLENLLSAGQADSVLELGQYLMKRGANQLGQSDDEGETGMEITECMEVVFEALMQSGLSPSQRLLWEIDLALQDDYSILDGLKGPVEQRSSCAREDWSQVADVLAARLAKMPERPADAPDSSSKYKREAVMRWLLHALEKAGRKEEVIPILEREAVQTQCYVELVKQLVNSGKVDKAREWAKKGFGETLKNLPGIAWQLEEQLREMAEREKNYALAASYRVIEFFHKPGVEGYARLKNAATKAGVWEIVRGPIMKYLETGKRPDIGSAAGKTQERSRQDQKSPSMEWPLPAPELPVILKDTRWSHFPDASTLVDIAIKEGRHEDVLRWYRAGKKTNGFEGNYEGEKVAQAVQNSHPDDALAIWKELVSREISHAKPAAYQTAGGYLKKMRKVYESAKRSEEWKAYLELLRSQNNRRPRMLDVLNSLEGRKTPIVSK